jgi:hypothetical protein
MTTTTTRTLRRPGRPAGLANLGIAVAVLALLLPLILRAATSAPPTAAEFSPNAKKVIKQAPPGQAAQGSGVGRGEGGVGTTTTTLARVAVPRNQVKKCIGPPPLRQIEDPQSPPCIAYWSGDNGGATATGVTRDAVYIVVPTPESAENKYTALANFFNNRFQFYGRKMVLEFCETNKNGSDQATQIADAANAASGCSGMPKPFASQFYRQNNGAYYMREMGCRYKTIVVGSYSPYDSKYLNTCPDYLYQYPMEVDEEFANVGEWICNRFVDKKAQWSDSPDASRKFGVLLESFTDDDPVNRPDSLNPIVSRLRACGADVPAKDVLVNPVTGIFDAASAQNAMLQLRRDGVTSVVCMCNFFSFGTLQRASTTSAFHPEWLTSTFGLNDVNSSFTLGQGPPDQMRNTFGVTFQPRIVAPLTNVYNVAVQEGDPAIAPDQLSTVEAELEVYRGLFVLATGIQMAGPHLTVQSFRDGLRGTVFPNPLTSAHAGFVDFRADGYSMTSDGAEWFWGAGKKGPFSDSNNNGTVCYIDHGNRHSLGNWPKGDAPFFSSDCDSGA